MSAWVPDSMPAAGHAGGSVTLQSPCIGKLKRLQASSGSRPGRPIAGSIAGGRSGTAALGSMNLDKKTLKVVSVRQGCKAVDDARGAE